MYGHREIEAARLPSEADHELLRVRLSRSQPLDPKVRVEHRLQEGDPVYDCHNQSVARL